jgi:hypothetical protein
MTKQVFWIGSVGPTDDFGDRIVKEFIDGRSVYGPWGIFTPKSWQAHGIRRLGTGLGQRYKLQDDGKWLKVEG